MPENENTNQCIVRQTLLGLEDPEDQAALAKALSDPEWSSASIVRVLKSEGVKVGYTAVKTHRRRDCICN